MVSREICAILEQFTPLIEPLSLDEAFLDVTGSELILGAAESIGRQIKQRIRSELELVASVGVAPNKFVAKIASDLEKPDGFVVVHADEVQSFLDPLPVGRLWGVGKVTAEIFERLSIRTIGQLSRLPIDSLAPYFGNSGEHFWKLAHGVDDRPVVPDREAKSISTETTFVDDIADMDLLRTYLVELVEQVARRMRGQNIKARAIELKVKFADFNTITRSLTLSERTMAKAIEELKQASGLCR